MALNESSNRRLAKNTIFLYFRTIILLIIGVFTSRITLQVLGVDNYGIVNVVSGFVTMFAIVNASLTGACQRFLSFELGKDTSDVHAVFNASFHIHLLLALIIIIIAETFGVYFINTHLNIPQERMIAAHWVFQCAVVSFVISLINVPYNAIIIAHEKMAVFAYLSLLEGFLKLVVVVSLLYFGTDKLILYAILGLVASIIVRITFLIYCRKAFGKAIRIKRKINKKYTQSILGFAGWTFLGNAATICSNQGVNIVLNIFCGVTVNAARGIAVMIEGIITGFVNNFTTSLNPQITKSYAQQDIRQLQSLLLLGHKIIFFLMMIITIPIIISANPLLHIWYTVVPEYEVIFVQLTLIVVFIQAMGNPVLTTLLATGKIRNYQLFAGSVTFLNLPISYILLKQGYSPICIYVTAIIIAFTTFSGRLLFFKHITGIGFKPYIVQYLGFIRILIISFGLVLFTYIIFPAINNIFELALFGLISVIINAGLIYLMGLSSSERRFIIEKIQSGINHINPNRM